MKKKYTHIIVGIFKKLVKSYFCSFWANFFEFWRLLIGSLSWAANQSLQNSKKSTKNDLTSFLKKYILPPYTHAWRSRRYRFFSIQTICSLLLSSFQQMLLTRFTFYRFVNFFYRLDWTYILNLNFYDVTKTLFSIWQNIWECSLEMIEYFLRSRQEVVCC